MGETVKHAPRRQEQEQAVDTELPVIETQVDTAQVDEMLDEIDDVLADNSETIDALLKEIDGILEENAEEFIANYQQRGGE